MSFLHLNSKLWGHKQMGLYPYVRTNKRYLPAKQLLVLLVRDRDRDRAKYHGHGHAISVPSNTRHASSKGNTWYLRKKHAQTNWYLRKKGGLIASLWYVLCNSLVARKKVSRKAEEGTVPFSTNKFFMNCTVRTMCKFI